MALRSIELFAGAGGLALGLERVGVRTVCFVEREAYAAAVLAARMGDGSLPPAPIWSDVCTFDGRPWRGRVDLVAGGFPCQDISHAGKGAGIIDGERSGLWREFARIVREVEPRYVFVENVSALLVRGLDVVLGDLASLGFDAEWGCVRASDAGAPHRRERVFILGYARDGDVVHVSGGRRDQVSEARRDGDCSPSSSILAHAREQHKQRRTVVADRNGRGRSLERERGLRNGEREERGDDAHGRGRRAPWPPGPGDAVGWREYLARWPGLEPAVCRGADGLAHRVDRLRALGNLVVPDQAELAFRALWHRLME